MSKCDIEIRELTNASLKAFCNMTCPIYSTIRRIDSDIFSLGLFYLADPRSSIADPRSSIADPRSSIADPNYTELGFQVTQGRTGSSGSEQIRIEVDR